ncbi:hypothetical protein N0V82_008266 [Gnomoniopsis sp. IMI 355080]|nr:hypothetical protein N0V82_008266 [Gnomoniopsis sp. IMI 355080]
MSSLFCCGSIQPYRPQTLSHEHKFKTFMSWAICPRESTASPDPVDLLALKPEFAVQLVRQVNYGPLESKRYFVPRGSDDGEFLEIAESDLIQANFQKLNAYKNYKCNTHDKFFEANLYQKDPINMHHWRANVARTATDIDL